MGRYCFGVDLGGTAIKFGLFTENGECIEKWDIRTRRENAGEHIMSDIGSEINAKIQSRGLNKADCIGIGFGVPGPVTKGSIVENCVNLGWGRTNVREALSKLTGGLTVVAGNDANVAALGEMYKGGGQGHESLIMITLGTGVGGGVVIDGHIHAGSVGAAGELGHLQVNSEEKLQCTCSNYGCVEQYASATGVVRVMKRLLSEKDEPCTLRAVANFSAKDVFDAMKAGDRLAGKAVDIMCDYLAIALANAATVMDPEIFVIGGGVSKAGTVLTDRIAESYRKRVLPVLKNKQFVLATLGNDAGIYGAAKLILSYRD